MRREIKFRGKSLNTGLWVFGLLMTVNKALGTAVITEHGCGHLRERWVIDLSTVGQYTGLKDALGNEIYEGDILERAVTGIPFEVEVVFHKGCFKARFGDSGFDDVVPLHVLDDQEIIQVVGNIHDTPELKEGKR